MNRIVRESFPVADLPETLREGFESEGSVRVTLERNVKMIQVSKKAFSLEALYARALPTFKSLDEIADHIDAVRSEWD